MTHVIPLSLDRVSQNVRDHTQPRKPRLNILDARVLVRMQRERPPSVRLVDHFDGSGGIDTDKRVKVGAFTFSGFERRDEVKDLVVPGGSGFASESDD